MVSSIWLFQYLAIMNYIMNKTAIMNNRNATLVYEFWVIQFFFSGENASEYDCWLL